MYHITIAYNKHLAQHKPEAWKIQKKAFVTKGFEVAGVNLILKANDSAEVFTATTDSVLVAKALRGVAGYAVAEVVEAPKAPKPKAPKAPKAPAKPKPKAPEVEAPEELETPEVPEVPEVEGVGETPDPLEGLL